MKDKQPCVYTQVASKMSCFNWIPAFAGMTASKGMTLRLTRSSPLQGSQSSSMDCFTPLCSAQNYDRAFRTKAIFDAE